MVKTIVFCILSFKLTSEEGRGCLNELCFYFAVAELSLCVAVAHDGRDAADDVALCQNRHGTADVMGRAVSGDGYLFGAVAPGVERAIFDKRFKLA